MDRQVTRFENARIFSLCFTAHAIVDAHYIFRRGFGRLQVLHLQCASFFYRLQSCKDLHSLHPPTQQKVAIC